MAKYYYTDLSGRRHVFNTYEDLRHAEQLDQIREFDRLGSARFLKGFAFALAASTTIYGLVALGIWLWP